MTVKGIGIHSGRSCRVELHRETGPLRFRRGSAEIPADLAHVVSTQRCTTLGCGSTTIAMVEHLLAALQVSGWWEGVVIDATADELPILDGSAAPWLPAIEALGPAPASPEPLVPDRSVRVTRGESSVTWEPGPDLVCAHIAFDHPAIGRQTWCGTRDDLKSVLPARTFGFRSEAEALQRAGLARGAGPENAIVFDEDGPSGPLRAPDEPVRHKVLDLVGDLTLLGRPLAGSVTADRGSHALHIAFMEQLRNLPHEPERRSA